MATQVSTMDFLLDQLQGLKNVTSRKMFGEYAVYVGGKVVAFVCDDQLFVKPTKSGRDFLGEVDERPAYPGSKNYFWISGEYWDDAEWLCTLLQTTAYELPMPKPKVRKKG